jgi:amino acid adenylation domain-containing protein
VEEIEERLVKHKDIKEAVVTALEDQQGGKYLAAYLVRGPVLEGKEFDVSHLREFLRRQLPDYMIPSYFVRLEQIPLTPNGKVENPVEKKLLHIWSEVLGIETNTIGIDDNFFERGGHSLRAIVMITKIHKELDIMLPLADIFKAPTIKGISVYLQDSAREKYAAIEPAEAKDYYPVSSAQKRLYFLHQLDPNSLGYNLPGVFVIEGQMDEIRLGNTFCRLIKRHESFRTSFGMKNVELVQAIHGPGEVEFSIEYYQTPVEIHRSFIRPFNLSRAPLLRIGLIKDREQGNLLLIDMHHIITDGTSWEILIKEFTALYSGRELARLKLQYKDFARWQGETKQLQLMNRQENYWVRSFSNEVPVLNLPLDYPRPAVQSFEGSRKDFRLTGETIKGLKKLAKESDATLYMSVLALLTLLLSKLSGQEDIIVGTPAAARRHTDLEHIIGLFINTLAMRNYPNAHKTFKEFLKEVKNHALDAFENQEYPFEDLVEQVKVKRDLSRNPIFDVMFLFHNQQQPTVISQKENPALKLERYEFGKRTSQFDLTLVGFEEKNHLHFRFEYCTGLFKDETIQRFINYFNEIVSSVLKHPSRKLSEMEIIPKEEKNLLLYQFNHTEIQYPKDKTIHELFREQVERTPDHVALVGVRETLETHEKNHNMSHSSHMSYKELNEKSNRLAFKLKETGVEPGTIAAIMVNRTPRMMVGFLGILKAGGAYLPLDPEYPEARIKYIIEKSGTPVLVTQKNLIDKCKDVVFTGEMIDVFDDRLPGENLSEKIDNRVRQISTMAPAYVIYTSGSTGNPKGVMVQHKNAVNFIKGMTSVIDFLPGKSILALTTISFDIFFLETLLPVTCGMKVVIADEAQQMDPRLLEKIILHQKVNMLQLTPSRLQLLLSFKDDMQYLSSAAELIVGGEAFPVHLFEQVRGKYTGKIYNVYGPTETTIWSTVKDLSHAEPGELTLGTPIANTQIYIVDKRMEIQPLGVAGELLIGGDGVATGYLNNVELTAEKFDHDLWDFQKKETGKKAPGKKDYRSYRSYKSYVLYRTGDLARWLPNGETQFLGRMDHQVKIRGFRVELEEIEEQLLGHEGIKEVVVITKTVKDGGNYLAAYIVPVSPGKEQGVEVSQLRDYLSRQLPHYMIPSYFISLEKIPLTPNGKIDRNSLPAPDESRPRLEATYLDPETGMEKIIAGIWQQELGVERIGVNDNFFDLGGNSLSVVKLISSLNGKFKKNIPVVSMFKYRTIRTFSRFLLDEAEGSLAIDDRSGALERGERDRKKMFEIRKRSSSQ